MDTKRIKIKEYVVINVAIGDTIIGQYIGTVKINAKWKPSKKNNDK